MDHSSTFYSRCPSWHPITSVEDTGFWKCKMDSESGAGSEPLVGVRESLPQNAGLRQSPRSQTVLLLLILHPSCLQFCTFHKFHAARPARQTKSGDGNPVRNPRIYHQPTVSKHWGKVYVYKQIRVQSDNSQLQHSQTLSLAFSTGSSEAGVLLTL